MIRRMVAMFVGGLGAVGASQAPEFAQQYAQRLGGAVDELKTIVENFDQDASKAGIARESGIQRLEGSSDTFVVRRGTSIRDTIRRFETLQGQQTAMQAPDVLTRVGAMVKDYDPQIASQAMKSFRPALPLTLEGAFFGLLGFLAGASAGGIAALPMGRRKVRQENAWDARA
jgi:Protein of unknown function (DUF2937)